MVCFKTIVLEFDGVFCLVKPCNKLYSVSRDDATVVYLYICEPVVYKWFIDNSFAHDSTSVDSSYLLQMHLFL